MAEYRTNEIISGLFVLLAVLVFSLFAFRVGDADLFGLFRGETLLCRSYFTDVKSLEKGVPVKVGGQAVGKVLAVRVKEMPLTRRQAEYLRKTQRDKEDLKAGMVRQLIEIDLELIDPNLRLNQDSARLMLRQDSLIAPNYLELDPGEWTEDNQPKTIFEADFPTEGLVIEAYEGGGLDELFVALTDSMKDVNAILARLNNEFLTTTNSNALANTLSDLETTMSKAKTVAESLESLFKEDRDPSLAGVLNELGAATKDLTGRIDSIQRETELLIKATREDMQKLVRTTGEDMAQLLQGTRHDAHDVLAGLSGVVTDNRAEVAEAIRRLRTSMWQAEMALRKIRYDPSVLLFGDTETDLEARATDESRLRLSGRARPYEQRDEANDSR